MSPKSKTDNAVPDTSFPVVGIGASAGGLEAVGEILKNLPADTGMAFIFAQHLAPGHPSLLAAILSKKTAMPLTDALDGERIEPNHVYVIPPNTVLTVKSRCLVIKPRNDVHGASMPIDSLFHSLAEDLGSNAICISLSGAGTDGARGMQSVKKNGGITFAQDATAEHTSMPQAAIDLGCVDFVLPPVEIAEELVRISHHHLNGDPLSPYLEPMDCNADSLKKIFQLLHIACKFDFTHYKHGTIKRRLARRMALQNFGNVPDYIDFLDKNPDEAKALGHDFLIHVTSFFRDPPVYEGLTRYVLPRLLEGRAFKSSLRIWVPGCSTGEEVYSIAICSLEYLTKHGLGCQIQIFGTDISETAVQQARSGIYAENISRHVSPERLQKFFVKTKDQYQVSRAVRDLCIFSRHDVTNDPPYSRLDMVSCHNLLIYLSPLLQKRVLSLLHYALNPDGILLLGAAENISGFENLFTLVEHEKNKFYIKNPVSQRSQLKYSEKSDMQPTPPPRSVSPPPVQTKKKYTESELRKREADRITLGYYVPAAVICDGNLNILEFRGDTRPYLAQPSGPPETNIKKLASPGLLVEITKAIHAAGKDSAPVRKDGIPVSVSGERKEITLVVVPMQSPEEEGSFLVFFEDSARSARTSSVPKFWSVLGGLVLQNFRLGRRVSQSGNDAELLRSNVELGDAQDHIRTMMEEHESVKQALQASQEELLSSNEEFQSTNEELETAKEELQSSNEELLTANEEVHHHNRELNKLNDKLQQALNYAETIIKTVSQPFLVLDGGLHILHANPAFYRTFNTAPDKTERQLLYNLGDGQWDIAELREFLHALVSKDTPFKDYEITHVFPKIGKKTMRLNGTHLVWEEHTQILLAIEDVSDYKNALDALKISAQRKDEFLAMLAHELRNPLAPIRNALEIWKRNDAGEKAEKESQIIMDRQLQKMVRLVDDLLDVARITRGVIALKKDPVDLVLLIESMLESARACMEERHHQFSVSVPAGAVFTKGDALRLEQIISNLLINAAKYTEPGGHISLILKHEEGQAVIRVIDDGIGIAPEMLPYIFDLFVQAERSLDRKQGGLGIGLTLVRRLVEMHGGSVEAKSGGLKKGAEFIVRLPATAVTDNVSPPPPRTPKKVTPGKRRILVVDDSTDATKTTQMLLELLGHTVQIALDGPSGISIAQSFKPEVIILDIGLPGMDGYEVARCLRALPESEKTLLIALSGYGQAEDLRKSKEAGFDYHLVKPAQVDQLQALIAKAGTSPLS